jgi:N-methylhydantoinase A/oxoprolinase/acetone carboxylase beta subunit
VGIVADLVASTVAKAGLDPADVTLFAFGGNGSMFAAPVAERLGISTARVFGLGPVFAAFGSSVSDVVHVYERSLGGGADARAAAAELLDSARRDLEAEGFDADAATIDVEFDLAANGSAARSGGSGVSPGTMVRAGTIEEALSDAQGGPVDVARIRARFPVGAYEPVGHPSTNPSTTPAPLARRAVSLGGVRHQAPIYDWGSLTGRGTVEGPAVAVGETMTCLVPPGWSLSIDEFANGVLRQG